MWLLIYLSAWVLYRIGKRLRPKAIIWLIRKQRRFRDRNIPALLHMKRLLQGTPAGILLYGPTPTTEEKMLIRAVQRGQEHQTATMLNCGANSNVTYGLRTPILMLAVYNRYHGVAQMLLEAGAAPNVRFSLFGHSALFHSALTNDAEMVRLLLSHGASVDGRDWTGFTPLAMAAFKGHTDVVKVLLEFGADPWLKSLSGNSPYRSAYIKHHDEIVSLFNAKWNEKRPPVIIQDNRERYYKRGANA